MKSIYQETGFVANVINSYNKYKIVIRFLSLGKNFTIDIPSHWNLSKLNRFIHVNFKEEIKNSEVSYIHLGIQVRDINISMEELLVS